ncbi:hypothetical protein [Helicobacter pylori]
MEKSQSFNKKDPKRETEFLIFHYQNPKYPLVFVRYWFYGCFNM